MVKVISGKGGLYDPHEAIFSLFEHKSEIPFVTEGHPREFKYKTLVVLILLVLIRNSSFNYVPRVLDYVMIGLLGYVTTTMLYRFLVNFNREMSRHGLIALVRSCAYLLITICIMSLFML